MEEHSRKEYWKCYWRFIKPYFWKQLLAFASTSLTTLLGLTSPMLMGILIDKGLEQGNMRMVYIILGISLSVLVVQNMIMALQDYLFGYIRNRLAYDLRMELFEKILSRDIFFFQKKNVGELMNRTIQEVRDVIGLFSTTLLNILTQIITFVGTFGTMFYLNWRLTLIACFAIPLVVLTMRFFNPRLRKINKQIMQEYSQAADVLQENLQGIRIIKNFRKEGYGILRFSKSLHYLINSQMRSVFLRMGNTQLLSYIYAIAPAALIIVGGNMVIGGAMSVGAFVAFYGYLGRFYGPIRSLSNINVQLQQTLVAFYRYYDLLHSVDTGEEGDNGTQLKRVENNVVIENVTFGYETAEEILLENFDQEFKPGQMIGIVGRNGIGKSTLFGLLTGLYHPSEGQVYVDDIPIRQLTKGSVRNLFGVVPQETFLFNMTIRENIAMGRRRLSEEKILELAEVLNIREFIESLPEGLDTMAEKNGENFSGGQRQKLGIIRALIHNPQILLLDEATSAIDVETEGAFFEWLAKNKGDKIIFYISHKPYLLNYADRIIRFEGLREIEVEEVQAVS